MEYDKIKQLMEDMGNSKLTSIDIDFADGTKIKMTKQNNQTIENNCVIEENNNKQENPAGKAYDRGGAHRLYPGNPQPDG